jgi:Carboxypeptidase regulatory-like domain/TonB-dependent Receptor Plug Domain
MTIRTKELFSNLGGAVIRALLCALLLALVIPVASRAQNYNGSITGIVSDPSGASVAGAIVTVTNKGTGETYTQKTTDIGAFSFEQLPVGTYDLHVTQANFKEFVVTDVEVHVSTPTVVNATLLVGAQTEKVVVEASPVQVDTTSAVVGEVVEGTQVRELPLNGENFMNLVTLSPGVSTANTFDHLDKGLAGGADFSVNGNPYNNNLFLVDGVNNNDVGSNRTILVYPSVDTIAEFKMLRNSYGPEYGQAAGAIISLTTKSGTNQWHGGLFYMGRNDALAANDFFSNKDGLGKAELRRNDYGYNASGPLIKNKLFIWWNQEWNRQIQGVAEAACVPSMAERTGDFTTLSCGAPAPVIPPAYQGASPSIIANPDPVGLLYGNYYPLPNIPGATGSENNWAQSQRNGQNWSEWNVRGDYDVTSRNRITVRWTNDSWTNPAPNAGNFWGDSIFPALGANWSQPSKSVMARLSSTISNSLVNDVEFGYGHNAIITTFGGSDAGLSAQIDAMVPTAWPASLKLPNGLPSIGAGGWGGLQYYGSYQSIWDIAPYGNHEDLYTVQDNLTKVMGNHVIKAGVFISTNTKIENGAGDADRPDFDPNSYAVSVSTGNLLANILIPGQIFGSDSDEASSNPYAMVRWHDFEWYVGDSWKLKKNLTVDYGFRWSFYREPFSLDNNWANFSLADWSATEAAANPSDACNGVVVVPGTSPCTKEAAFLSSLGIPLPLSAGTPGANRALVNNNNHSIAPRFGIAWDVRGDGKTAVRAGAGQFFTREEVGLDEGLAFTAPFVIHADDARTFETPTPLVSPSVSPSAAKNPRGIVPNSWQWNVSVERELFKNTVLNVGYVGNSGIHLTSMADLNQIPQANWLAGAFISGPPQNALRPASNFGEIGEFSRGGHATYHSLQVLFRSQLTNHSQFQASYTYSHSIGNVDLDNSSGGINQEAWLDNSNPGLNKGNTNINRPNIFVANEVLFLPKFGDKSNAIRQSVGGWELNSIVTAEDGNSLTVYTSGATGAGIGTTSSSLNSLIGTGWTDPQRPIRVSGVSCNSGPGVGAYQVLNPAAFTLTGYTIGSIPTNMEGRGDCSGPDLVNFDVQLAKNWILRERFRIKLQFDFFNMFNHPNFSGNNLNTTYSGSGLICGGVTVCSPTNNVVTGQESGVLGNFGQAIAVLPPRQIQYGLHFSF